MKTRFTTLDVSAAVCDLQEVVGSRLVNVYDINHKTYLLKLTQKKTNRAPEKHMILLESGIRIHRTFYDHEKSHFPSSFSQKLRKHIKNRRLTMVSQLGIDRVVDLCFGDDETACHIIVELYDRGNVVLTDVEYTILNVLRPRTDKDKDVDLHVGERYPMPSLTDFPTLPDTDRLLSLLSTQCDPNLPARRAVVQPGMFCVALIDHALHSVGLNPDTPVNEVANPSDVEKISSALHQARNIAQTLMKQGASSGYLFYKMDKKCDGSEIESNVEYQPFLFKQLTEVPHKKFPSFSQAVDEFYGALEAQKQQQSALKAEKEALKKLENVKVDQTRRLVDLEKSLDEKKIMADLVILNQDLVNSAISIVCKAIAMKTEWTAIEQDLIVAAKNNNVVARSIAKLDLSHNRIVMSLSDPTEGLYNVKVPIDLDMNAQKNASEMFHVRKAISGKIVRTAAAAEKALRNAEKTAFSTIKQVHIRADVTKIKKEFWFEKFLWFFSSDGYLVIGGKDAQQNERIVKRYLRPGDLYVHADARGASSVVIRNKKNVTADVPPKTIMEAGQMAICYSSMWNSDFVTSAWWVGADQVSKTPPTGEFLSTGAFIIKGRRNLIPSYTKTLGFGILFGLDDESTMRRKKLLTAKYADDYTGDNMGQDEKQEEDNADNVDEFSDGSSHSTTEFPDVQIVVPTVRLEESALADESTVISFSKPARAKPAKTTKEVETQQYLESREAEQKAVGPKKGAKREKHKKDKIRKKYRDQDDEEREMRLALLGSRESGENAGGKQGKRGKKGKPGKQAPPPKNDKGAKQPSGPKGNKESGAGAKANEGNSTISCDNKDPSASATPTDDAHLKETEENVPETKQEQTSGGSVLVGSEASGGENTAQDRVAEKKTASNGHASDDDANAEGGDENEDPDEDVENEAEDAMYKLTEYPEPGDRVLWAVPMVGPYQVFTNFKYKVKLTHGNLKRNKVAKHALDYFKAMKHNDPVELALIRELGTEGTAGANIPSGCRVQAPGLYRTKD
ncbi:unnamed protein product [Nippostrongylus brasiliensis]|uniref:Nuclear export mediator factor NEMF (inferred by orthology to a human protein) n=1 Tax=Nippostrongylus brasiliensis TaxID=27835 RepID=A0A0N4Y1C9_NIPBR|nr:unnamed protein product [Nippostrongylus brasiliensis]